MQFEPVIGLEVHVQLDTETKIFCSCSTDFGASPNAHTCPVCTGMPGVLPVLNQRAVTYAIKTALATNCRVAEESRFDRKNYFYPDLPKGYQITQFAAPIAEHGKLNIELADGSEKTIGITRIHMEEDAGKLIHDPDRPRSMVDLNRAGIPLVEIVSEPDMRTPEEAGAYLRKLHAIVRYIGVCNGNMEEGSFRCDANISLRPRGRKEFGTRTELKNLNSFRNVERAIAYEIKRQTYVLEKGKEVIQETRLWDTTNNRTASMRGKEEAHDYRYFPEPDLVPLIVDDTWINEVKNTLPELPDAKKQRFIAEYTMAASDASVLTSSIPLADFFEHTAAKLKDKKLAANWIMGPVLALLKEQNTTISDLSITPDRIAELLKLMETGKVNANAAKTIFDRMVTTDENPGLILKEMGLEQVSDQGELEEMVDEVLAANPDEVAGYQGGKTKLIGFFMGQIMKKSRGKADPAIVTRILKEKLNRKP